MVIFSFADFILQYKYIAKKEKCKELFVFLHKKCKNGQNRQGRDES